MMVPIITSVPQHHNLVGTPSVVTADAGRLTGHQSQGRVTTAKIIGARRVRRAMPTRPTTPVCTVSCQTTSRPLQRKKQRADSR